MLDLAVLAHHAGDCNAWCRDGDHAELVFTLAGPAHPPRLCGRWRINGRDVIALRAEPAPEAPPPGRGDPARWTAWTVWFRWVDEPSIPVG